MITLIASLILSASAFAQVSPAQAPAQPPAKTEAASAAANQPAAQATESVEGPIAKVVAKKKEIYVQGADKKHEFYFKANTQLLQNGQPADFSVLKEGMKVRVDYVKVGKRTDPVKVEILQ